MARKYRGEIHANEILLLAYYIAAVNIEQSFAQMMMKEGQKGGKGKAKIKYEAFDGMYLTDSFQLYEGEDSLKGFLHDNSEKLEKQRELDIRVIIGNPPWSTGQGSENDDAKNIAYSNLDESIQNSYAHHSKSSNKRNLFDSYIRAFRWAGERVKEQGLVTLISNNGWLDRSFADGMRKAMAEDYSQIWLINLRGDIRRDMLSSGQAGEGANIFGNTTMTGVSIAFCCKNPKAPKKGEIFYAQTGDGWTQKKKLAWLADLQLDDENAWRNITPDQYYDWLDQRDEDFYDFLPLGDKKNKQAKAIFANYSLGIITKRDAWCYSASKKFLAENMRHTIGFYNQEIARYQKAGQPQNIDSFVSSDAKQISWGPNLKRDLQKGKEADFNEGKMTLSSYRPFEKKWLYYDRQWNERVGQMPQIFPEAGYENRVITVTGIGAKGGFSVLMVGHLTNLHFLDSSQAFPFYLYEPVGGDGGKLALDGGDDDDSEAEIIGDYRRRPGITGFALQQFRAHYSNQAITREDIFHYIYGLLHAPDYRARYQNNLIRSLPHIPLARAEADFKAFVKAGRKLGDLHLNYENLTPFETEKSPVPRLTHDQLENYYRVKKMAFGRKNGEKDKSTIIYNHNITLPHIPLEAYDYVVSGKSAIEWVMNRQEIKTDKASKIINDPNIYANETMQDAEYPLLLLKRIIRLSLESLAIIKTLPALDI